MAIRFTDTDKWSDVWFSELTASAKLLFMYFCDFCDAAGFLEVNPKRIAFDCGISKKEVEDSLGQLNSKLIYSKDRRYVFIRNFIRHQKNLPLNDKNNAHKGIIKRLEENLLLFDFKDINQFVSSPSLAPSEPLIRGTGKGIGNGNIGDDIGSNKGGMGEKEKGKEGETWRTSYETYKNELRNAYKQSLNDTEFLQKMERYHPGIDIKLSLEKACVEFWSLEAGWKKKKASRSVDIDWTATFTNALNLKSNQVYKRENGAAKEAEKLNEKGDYLSRFGDYAKNAATPVNIPRVKTANTQKKDAPESIKLTDDELRDAARKAINNL